MPDRVCQRPGCGRAISSRRRKDTRWCSRSCESKAARAARRNAEFEAAHPGAAELLRAEDLSLDQLHARARPPARRAVDPVYSDELDLDDDHPDDDGQGAGRAYLNDAGRAYKEADDIRARYEARIRPLLSTQARNGGVKLPAIARLEAERDARINAVMKAHWKAEALDRAAREQPKYIASAHERAVESAALTAFANDLRRGQRGVSPAPTAGRPTEDVFLF